MLRIWLREWPLFRNSFWSWMLSLAFFAILDSADPGAGQGALEAASFAVGMGFAFGALSREARLSTVYFAALPLDPQRSRRCCVDAGMFWLLVLVLGALAFQYAGPANAIVRWMRRLGEYQGDSRMGSRMPALDRLALPLLGYWLSATILLSVGFLRGLPQRLIDVLLLLPLIVVVIGGVIARHTWLDARGGWRHWAHLAGTGLATLLLAWWLARRCLKRIARTGTELGTKGVLS